MSIFATAHHEDRILRRQLLNFILREFNFVPLSLHAALPEQLFPSDAIGKAEIVFDHWLPFRHRMTGINHKGVALRATEVDRRRQSRDSAADDDDLAAFRRRRVFMSDHAELYAIDGGSGRPFPAVPSGIATPLHSF